MGRIGSPMFDVSPDLYDISYGFLTCFVVSVFGGKVSADFIGSS